MMPQVVVAFLWEQADYLMNLLAPLAGQGDDMAALVYDQIEQSQAQAIDDSDD